MISFFKSSLFIIFFLCVSFGHAEEDTVFNPKTEEESLFLRRIAEFWQDGEIEIAKYQIESFINDNPSSSLIDSLNAILGNIYMNEKDYTKAVTAFDNIKSQGTKDKIAINLLTSLYHLNWHARLIKESQYYLSTASEDLKDKIIYLYALSLYNRQFEIKEEAEKQKLIDDSKNNFEKLLETKFDTQARQYLSEIYKNNKNYQEASKYYMELAQRDIQKKAAYLFQAALLQAHFDKELALLTFNQITENNEEKVPEAAYNKLLLLFEMNRHDNIISEKTALLEIMPQDKIALANFLIGKSHFILKDYKNAIDHLEKSYSPQTSDKQIKQSLVMLMQSSFYLNNFDLFNITFDKFLTKYPKDEQLFECLFAKALMHKNNKNYENAKKDFEKIITDFPEDVKNHKFLYEYAHLLFKMEENEKSKLKFKEFIQNYPKHEFVKLSLINIINCSIQELQKQQPQENLLKIRNALIAEINDALQNEELFSQQEKDQYKYLLAKTYFDIENYDLCLNILQNLIKNNETSFSKEEEAEIHLLIGFCHKNINNNLDEFINYTEKALTLSENSKHGFAAYVNLFNSYLSLAQKTDPLDEGFLEKAAGSLFKAFVLNPKEINKNNLIWLTDYYCNNIESFLNKNYKNTVISNKDMILFSQNSISLINELLNIDKDNFEEYTIKLAKQLYYQNKFDKASLVLEKNMHYYRLNSEKSHTALEMSIYDLAKIYEKLEAYDKALSLYNEFLPSFKKDNIFYFKSLLHFSRLQFANLREDEKVFTNPTIQNIISNLKTISLKKNLENEPLHLEAALDYVDIVCYMENNNKWAKRLLLLERLKDNFCSQKDVISKDYQSMRKNFKEKDKIFTSYMNVVDAEIAICLSFLENDIKPLKKAKDLLNKDNLMFNQYLETRIEKNMDLIKECNFEEK